MAGQLKSSEDDGGGGRVDALRETLSDLRSGVAALVESKRNTDALLKNINRQLEAQGIAAVTFRQQISTLEGEAQRLSLLLRDSGGIIARLAVLEAEIGRHMRDCESYRSRRAREREQDEERARDVWDEVSTKTLAKAKEDARELLSDQHTTWREWLLFALAAGSLGVAVWK